MQMIRKADAEPQEDRAAIKAELHRLPPDRPIAEALFTGIWIEVKQSRSDFVISTGNAFRYLGVCDEVRTLIGGIWASGFRQWNSGEQLEFLRLLLSSKELHRDFALEFLPFAIPDLTIKPQDFLGWIIDCKQDRVGYPHKIPAILQSYARATPQNALQMAGLLVPKANDAANARLVALLVHWVREFAVKNEVRAALASFEATLSSGSAEERSILLDSWAYSAATTELTEKTASELKQRLVRGAVEAKSWCFLLQQVVLTSPDKWAWAMTELRALAVNRLSAEQRYTVISTALNGWLHAGLTPMVTRVEWEELIRTLTPFKAEEEGVWDHLAHFLVDAFEKDAVAALTLVTLIAETSGRGWSSVMADHEDKFKWWCQTLRDSAHAQHVVPALCFSNARSARQVGLRIAQHCGTDSFGPATISHTTAAQVERLLLEAAIMLAEQDFIGRLHLAFAARIDEFGATLAEWFYDEVMTQALNTDKYRKVILEGASENSKMVKVVNEAVQRIDASVKASQSPALRMRIPGYSRAEALSMRHMGRMVAEGMTKHSTFLHLFPAVPLLYGKSWRMTDSSGAVGSASTLKKVETSMEIPRLEFMIPEAMRHRRLSALQRIAELDRGAR